ncbi:MAG TPA: hypothetical protein VF170_08835 [Planctomycetaceae bacterium]
MTRTAATGSTAVVRVARMILNAVCVGTATLLLFPPLVVRVDYAMLSPGDVVAVAGGVSGLVTVEAVIGESLRVRTADGLRLTIPRHGVREL